MAADMAALETCLDDDASDEYDDRSRREHASPVQSRSILCSCGRFQHAKVDMTATRRFTAPPARTGDPPAEDSFNSVNGTQT